MSVAQASDAVHRPRTDPLDPILARLWLLVSALAGGLEALLSHVLGTYGRLHTAASMGTLHEQAFVETQAHVSGPVMQIGQAILVAVIILIILGELYATDIVANPDNPNTFTNLTETFAQYGETAYIMVGLGLIALGASVALSYFGGFGGGGR